MALRSSADLPEGEQRLGPYRLIRPISAGGMARVYEGRLDSLAGVSTRVAIKVIHPDYADDDGFQDLFITEARNSARLEHQNVVRVQQFNREGRLYYLVMEYIDGVTFRRLISLSRRQRILLTPAIIGELGRQACEGLHYAHTLGGEDGRPLGLVHRDVKPSNLMLTTQGLVKLLDFGISTALAAGDARAEPGRMDDGGVRGTWGYMAPEQADAGRVGPASDVYGLAAVLFEMVTGEALFEEKDNARIRERMAADDAARRAATLGGQWAPLGSLLMRALQRDPAARYPSAAAFGRALAAVGGDPVAAHENLLVLMTELSRAEPGTNPARGERARSVSTVAPPGLPIAVGNAHAPRAVTKERGVAPPPARLSSWVILGVLLAALGVASALMVTLRPSVLRGVWADSTTAAPAASAPLPVNSLPAAPPPPSSAAPVVAPPPAVVPPDPSPVRAPAATRPVAPAGVPVRSAEPPVDAGVLTVSSVPRAQVLLDGVSVDYTPYFQHPLASGSHSVVLVAEDGRRKSFKVEVKPGEETRRLWLFDEERWGEL